MAANMMMELLRNIQRDLADQKDYVTLHCKNLQVVHTTINEKFNLMEQKLNQLEMDNQKQQAILKKLEVQVKKNNTLLFGNDIGIEFEDETATCKENDANDETDKIEKNEASQFQTLNKECLLEQPNRQVDVIQHEDVPISQNYLSAEKVWQLRGKLKKMMPAEMSTYEDQINELKSQLKEMKEKHQSEINEMRNLIQKMEAENETHIKKTSVSVAQQKRETIQIPSYLRPAELTVINTELKKIGEKYQETNFPNIEIVQDKSFDSHPVIEQLMNNYKGVVAIDRLTDKAIYIDTSIRWEKWEPPVVHQLRNRPHMTLCDFIEVNWEAIQNASGILKAFSSYRFYADISDK
ncbi:uncharacterized protein LOC125234256 [Leguminivora glycinivorella]|uniref:uncharacterized protein LOC125234256 n=1 Tax=Leguminivora glycinivorella TaxID=1035111 RepID=UPI00200DB636|nr:uncharacterized protein LOC125234256 [Leguminivora glycinivorella]